MEYKIKAYNIWEPGKRVDANGNPHQEDAIYPAYGKCAPSDSLFVVCDGMGGHDNGEVASNVVCEALSTSLLRRLSKSAGQFREQMFDDALNDAYDALDKNDTHAPKKMGTTMAMLLLYSKGYFAAHIGDSRVYHVRPGKDAASTEIVFVSTDHSLVNSLVRSGKMSVEEAQKSSKRHVITRAMQPAMEFRPKADVELSADVRTGDYFMVCSHGMLEHLNDESIRYIFSEAGGNDRNKFNLLLRASSDNKDNHSAIIVHVEEVSDHIRHESYQQAEVAEQHIDAPQKNTRMKQPSKLGKVGTRTREFIDRRRGNNDLGNLVAKFLLALMVLLTLIMLIYYLFIHHNEAPPEAGHAIDDTVKEEQYMPDDGANEVYGYETEPTAKTDDEGVGEGTDETVQPETDNYEDGVVQEPAKTEESEEDVITTPVEPAAPTAPTEPTTTPYVEE